jgi:hypothetical protein
MAGALFRIGGAVAAGTVDRVSLSGSGTIGVLAGRTLGAGLLVGTVVVARWLVLLVCVGTVVIPRWPVLLVWAEASATVIRHDATIPRYLILFIKFPLVN